MDIDKSHLNFNSKDHNKCKFAPKLIPLVITSTLFSSEVVQICQHCQCCALRENSNTRIGRKSVERKKGHFYRPQRSWARVIFLQASVCPQGGSGVCLSACWDIPPPTPGADSPGADTQTRPTRSRDPPDQAPPHLEQRPLDPPRAEPQQPPPPWGKTPLLGSRLQHTVNERPLRILLECILVVDR